MNPTTLVGLDAFTELSWMIVAIGVAVGCFAFVMGRRFLIPRRLVQPPPPQPPSPVDVFLEGSLTERRAAPRRRGNNVEVYLAEGPDRNKLPAWVVDRSIGGLCLLIDNPVPPGSVWQVRPRTAPESIPWTPIEVRTCRPEQGEWEVGCRFVQTPPWNIMLLFG